MAPSGTTIAPNGAGTRDSFGLSAGTRDSFGLSAGTRDSSQSRIRAPAVAHTDAPTTLRESLVVQDRRDLLDDLSDGISNSAPVQVLETVARMFVYSCQTELRAGTQGRIQLTDSYRRIGQRRSSRKAGAAEFVARK